MQLHYSCWSRGYKETIKHMTEQEANLCHRERKLYCVVMGDENSPSNFLEINNDFIYVGFLDDLQREYQSYEFNEIEPEKLFLKEIQIWEYEQDTDNKISSIRYRFTTAGNFGIQKVDLRTRESYTTEPEEPVDVSELYEKYPKFGEYKKLTRTDRIDLKRLPV